MTINAKVIAHSRAAGAPDLITLQVKYPRMVHSEMMTHRVFSRNASSSRAIPIERMIQDVIDDPAKPVAWGSNKPGMQAGDEILTDVEYRPEDGSPWFYGPVPDMWCKARDHAVAMAKGFAKAGYHKQIANRLLEPFAHISVVITATEWDNFFDLRCHPDADPTMRAVAEAMRDAICVSMPRILTGGEWHLPYVDVSHEENPVGWAPRDERGWRHLAMISAARCARVSYLNHDGSNPDIEKDLALAKRLLESRHMSPFEHQARVTGDEGTAFWGNFNGWDQHRQMIEALS